MTGDSTVRSARGCQIAAQSRRQNAKAWQICANSRGDSTRDRRNSAISTGESIRARQTAANLKRKSVGAVAAKIYLMISLQSPIALESLPLGFFWEARYKCRNA